MTTTLNASRPEDLLAAVPVVLGFRPEDSLVMLTFGASRTFHARVCLPEVDDSEAELPGVAELVRALLDPCLRHAVRRVVFIAYDEGPGRARSLARPLRRGFARAGIEVVYVLRSHGGRWWHVSHGAAPDGVGQVHDDRAHPFHAQAVLDGRATLASREEVRALVAPDEATRTRWARLMGERHADPDGVESWRAADVLATWVDAEAAPDDAGAALVLGAVTRVEVRDAALYAVSRPRARAHLEVWSALLRGAPDAAVPDVAAVTAFCAWLTGDGALAWCALDRCLELEPDHRLGQCIAECLRRAVPPTTWEGVVGQGAGDLA